MSKFYKPTTLQFSLLEVLSFYEYGLRANHCEVPETVYTFYKKNGIKGKFLSFLGFDIDKVIHSTNDYSDMEQFLVSYIGKNFPDVKPLRNGLFEITM